MPIFRCLSRLDSVGRNNFVIFSENKAVKGVNRKVVLIDFITKPCSVRIFFIEFTLNFDMCWNL